MGSIVLGGDIYSIFQKFTNGLIEENLLLRFNSNKSLFLSFQTETEMPLIQYHKSQGLLDLQRVCYT